jgi:two-component system cell cycle response regulator
MAIQTPNILIVDDREIAVHSIRKALQAEGYHNIRSAHDAQQALAMHAENPAEVILADWMMPGMDGLELTEAIRRHDEPRKHYTAVVLFTAKEGTEPLVEAFERGVDDYLRKPVEQRELAARVYAASRIAARHNTALQTMQVLQRDNQRLQELAISDPLTGLGNRRYMQAHLEALIAETKSRGGVASCSLVDIDHFKTINDRFGHPVGDEVLIGFAQRLKWSVRPTDVVTRIGGEEFAIIMHHPDPEKFSPMIFERMRRTITQHPIKTSTGDIPLTASIGVACYTNNDDDILPEDLLKHADENLYKAKNQGRNRVIC